MREQHERKKHPHVSANEEFARVMLAIGFGVILACVVLAAIVFLVR